MKNAWSEKEINTLKEMWSQGKTGNEISKVLDNKSRSSVLAKARNLNLSSRVGKKTCSENLGNKEQHTGKNTDVQKPEKYKPNPKRQKISNTAYGDKCTLKELKSNQCVWPVGDPKDSDFGFCGAQCGSNRYCEEHSSIAYVKRKN